MNNGTQQPQAVEVPADALVGFLVNRIAQITAELELARATIAYLTTAPATADALVPDADR